MLTTIQFLLLPLLANLSRGSLNCPTEAAIPLQFHLVRECQRASADDALALESTSSLEDCAKLARAVHGLALNYAPGGPTRSRNRFIQPNSGSSARNKALRSQLTVFEQPAEFFNCHVLQCPQNNTFGGMVNDSRFDYYSLYGRPTTVRNYSCVPQVGLFLVYTNPSSYLNASLACSNSSEFDGSLVHIASESRTRALSQWMLDFNRKTRTMLEAESMPDIFLAYVGLSYNRTTSLSLHDFRNAQHESLMCFLYRAWDVGHPGLGQQQANASCVALTPQGTWHAINCKRELPFICEIFTASPMGWKLEAELDTGPNAVAECRNG
ncbi:uncharacterized protein LOC117578692 [Drosophila guanche]|uniref:C-type lectin domain-containing protein n=1 Tax=Drosophila guanche TaxID=7266 RepID=A0A3B0IZW5_DROGU|nr:uncharacterized protein LOC117578692 [Drosophila guanche]SPP73747.1 Hypothetical predicted protein [Drosophila guanche]